MAKKMKNRKNITFIILTLLFLQTFVGLTYFNFNNIERNETQNIDPKKSDIIVGNYTIPGIPFPVPLNQSIKIGLLDDMNDPTGDHAWKGALLAAREINQAGGIDINGTIYYIALTSEDTDEANATLDLSKGVAAANRMITYNNPQFILGGFRAEALQAYQEVIMDAKIPFLCTGSSNDIFCENVLNNYNRYKYFFRVMPMNGTSLATELITYILTLKSYLQAIYGGTVNSVAIIREDLSWSAPLSTALQSILPPYGLSVVEEIAFPITATSYDFESYWSDIDAAGAQITISIVSSPAGINMVKAYDTVKPKCLLAGINVQAQLDSYWDDTEGKCQYEILMQNIHKTNKTTLTIPFWDSYIATYGTEPFYTGAGSYDAVKLIAEVISNTQSFSPDPNIAALENITKSNPFEGVSGNIAFTISHDLVEGYPYAFTLYSQWQLDGNKIVVPSFGTIYPDTLATGSTSIPYWGINGLVGGQALPGDFTLTSNASMPDKDGKFNLTWTNSAGAISYSVYMYDKPITYINNSLQLLADKSAQSPFQISGLKTGKYYCIVAAYNGTRQKLSNNVEITVERPKPGNFTLSSNAGSPDTNGVFNMTWTVSDGADNYSIFTSNHLITEINESIAILANQTGTSPFPITGLSDGVYYFVGVAYNGTGETMSNNVNVTVLGTKPGNFILSSDADTPDMDGAFNLNWTVSEGADNYSIYSFGSSITTINTSLITIADQIVATSFPITGLLCGNYYFVVVAYNKTGQTLSNNEYVEVRIPPGNFILSSDADTPDTDGAFNLNWTVSEGADNYSIYSFGSLITMINTSLTIIANQTATSPFPITGLSKGLYYFVAVAYNETGETLSNNIWIEVQVPPKLFNLSSDADSPIDTDGVFNLTWTESAGADNYSIYLYSRYITDINSSLITLEIETNNTLYQIIGLSTGNYYFIVVANNNFGSMLSNCIKITVQIYDSESGYWILNPLLIDNTGIGDYTWLEVANLPWCTGSGTLVDPYIINNIKINGLNQASCLTIRSSSVYFEIQNCSFYNSGSNLYDGGIKLIATLNGKLISNNCSFNNGNGIVVISCQSIVIAENSINHNERAGIVLIDSSNIDIMDNKETINFNDLYGIYLFNSHYNDITNNTINNNGIGIYLNQSNYNTIDWNTLLGNSRAIVDNGIGNILGSNNVLPPGGFPFNILIIILIVSLAIVGVTVAVILIKRRRSIPTQKVKEISEKKREKIRIKLESNLEFVDYLIRDGKIALAYKKLGKIQDTADEHEFFDIFNEAMKKVERCKNLQEGVKEVAKSEPIIAPLISDSVEKEERKKHNIFISYSTLDSEYFQINKIVKKLKKYPIIDRVLYWERDSKENIVEFMDRTLKESDVFILFCTERSMNSAAVSDEWQAAFQRRKKGLIKMIPVYENEDHVPPLLGHLLNVKYTKDDFNSFIDKLHREILR